MAQENAEEVVTTLNNLIEINLDGEKGYQSAAEAVRNSDYAAALRACAAERRQFAAALSQAIQSHYGQTPAAGGSSAGTLHRAWLNIKAAIGRGDAAIVAECLRGDESALNAYQKALRRQLPDDIVTLLRTQYTALEKTYDEISVMYTAIREQK